MLTCECISIKSGAQTQQRFNPSCLNLKNIQIKSGWCKLFCYHIANHDAHDTEYYPLYLFFLILLRYLLFIYYSFNYSGFSFFGTVSLLFMSEPVLAISSRVHITIRPSRLVVYTSMSAPYTISVHTYNIHSSYGESYKHSCCNESV